MVRRVREGREKQRSARRRLLKAESALSGRRALRGAGHDFPRPYQPDESEQYLRVIRAYSPLLIRLLGAYWDCVQRFPGGREFYNEFLGSALPDLDLSRPEDLRRALDHVENNGYPPSAINTMNDFGNFFSTIVIKVRDIFPSNPAWKDAKAWVCFRFSVGWSRLLEPGQSIMVLSDWRNMVDAHSVGIEPDDGYVYRLEVGQDEHSVQPHRYIVSFHADSGSRYKRYDDHFGPGEPGKWEDARVDLEVVWGGPLGMAIPEWNRLVWRPEIYDTPEDAIYP